MKFELFVVVGVLMCVTLCKGDPRWCLTNKTTAVVVHKPAEDDPLEMVTENVTAIQQFWVCCEGYSLQGRDCVATCEGGCPETQKCVEPGVCGCEAGHHLKDKECYPDCESCENGRCSEPGICQCDTGYIRIGDKCQPHCKRTCANGFCESPDKCVCNEGYRESPETNECEPICEQECGANAFCTATGACQCKPSFFRNDANLCQSWCTTQCKNGDCVGPNNCACYQGFVKVDGMCIPDCKSGCKFGDCKDEELCVCWSGYVYNATTRNCEEENSTVTTKSPDPGMAPLRKSAEEPCPEYCPNGKCISGTCQCGEGRVRANLVCASHCEHCQFGECVPKHVCEHLARVVMGTVTKLTSTTEDDGTLPASSESSLETSTAQSSTCATGCWAGTCMNGVCQCTEGLVLSAGNDCIRPCEVLCKNGICTQDNVCVCQLGYVLKNGTECVPVCEKGCVNGFCIRPNECKCNEGYSQSMSPNQEDTCLPTCDGLEGNEGCLNGTCIGVNKCECREGLIFNPNNRFECIPYPVDVAERRHKHSWYIYLLIGILIVLLMVILLLLALRKFHQDSYNVDKVEQRRATVQYQNGEQVFCVV